MQPTHMLAVRRLSPRSHRYMPVYNYSQAKVKGTLRPELVLYGYNVIVYTQDHVIEMANV